MKRGVAIGLGAVFVVLVPFVVARVAGSSDAHWKQGHARAQVDLLGGMVEQYAVDNGRLPTTLVELTQARRYGPYTRSEALIDPGDRPFFFQATEPPREFTVFTLGKDGRLGGRGDDADFYFDSKSLREDPP